MTVLIVGGDRVSSTVRLLAEAGFAEFAHWSGRKSGEQHQAMPQDTELVVMLIDQVGHSFAGKVRQQASAQGLPVIYAPRSRARLHTQLQRLHLQ
ncbi:MAG: DUF2325 domain-containing protein [Aeromonadaceae bacterium]